MYRSRILMPDFIRILDIEIHIIICILADAYILCSAKFRASDNCFRTGIPLFFDNIAVFVPDFLSGVCKSTFYFLCLRTPGSLNIKEVVISFVSGIGSGNQRRCAVCSLLLDYCAGKYVGVYSGRFSRRHDIFNICVFRAGIAVFKKCTADDFA